jgi:predicted nucleotidyltransferase
LHGSLQAGGSPSAARASAQSAQHYRLTLILGTDANVRVIRELSRHGGLLSSPLIAARSRLARASVWSALGTLEEIGIVHCEGSGKARLYRIDDRHPLAVPLNALFEAEAARYAGIREAVSAVCAAVRPPVLAAWIYGSVARGEDRLGSDLDLAVVAPAADLELAEHAIRGALAISGEELGFVASLAGLGPDDVARLSREADPWWTGVAADALVVLGPRPGELAKQLRRRRASA